jgi:hemerythrin-like domain-containing protein
MTSTTSAWPEQLRLPGQAAAAPGPADMSVMYLMHHAFRRELRDLAAAAVATPASDRDAWVSLAQRWAFFASVLHHHHAGEDSGLWPALLARVGDDHAAVLEAMEAEHAQIDPLLEACTEGFRRLAEASDDDARAALAVRLTAGRQLLTEHLRHEETQAIPLVQRTMTAEEWRRIEEEHFAASVTFRRRLAVLPWVLAGLPADIRRGLFSRSGGRAHQLVWLLTRGWERRSARRAFRYLR